MRIQRLFTTLFVSNELLKELAMALMRRGRELARALRARTSSCALPTPLKSRNAHESWEQFDLFAGMADDSNRVRIDGYGETGFITNDNADHEGSIICLSKFTLSWTPRTFSEVTPDSLCIFELLRPAPEILVIGCGPRIEFVRKDVRDFLRSNGIKIEAVDSRNAASTFNFLNMEGRLVAAAMLPYGIPT